MAQHYTSIWPASVVMGTCGVCDSRLVDLPVLDTPYQHGQAAGSGVYTIPLEDASRGPAHKIRAVDCFIRFTRENQTVSTWR